MFKNNEMIQQITDKIAAFLAKTVKTIKKMDRRLLIMISAAVVLVIIIFALIINGLSSDKDNDEPVTPQDNIVSLDEPSTDYENILPVQTNGAGTYKVETGSAAELNMRLAADKESDVITTIPNGTQLEVMFIDDFGAAEGEAGWGYVNYNGERGWVFMQYLKK
ncbi:MAG: SH3 domain-containing protein [Clostridia bacterium]|nr:SH3 domain-containing protein [Clostridia bacterium]